MTNDIGLRVGQSKTGHRQMFTWLDEHGEETGLRAAVEMAKAARPLDMIRCPFALEKMRYDGKSSMVIYRSKLHATLKRNYQLHQGRRKDSMYFPPVHRSIRAIEFPILNAYLTFDPGEEAPINTLLGHCQDHYPSRLERDKQSPMLCTCQHI